MKTRLGLLALIVVIGVAGLAGAALAFHSGGVAECTGCHSMHSPKSGGMSLLLGTDQSSTCLTCHERAGDTGPNDYHISTADADMSAGIPPKQRTPGGDFGWLKKTYSFVLDGTPTTDLGERNGHNIVAVDKGYVADTTNTTAPGGTYPAANLSCNSCHDPHSPVRRKADGSVVRGGQPIKDSGSYNGSSNEPTATEAVGVYRLLAGNGYRKPSDPGLPAFTGVPAAKAPSTYNQTEITNQVRVAYGNITRTNQVTWSQWCGTCHPDMHGSSRYLHPVDVALPTAYIGNYNAYVKSGNISGIRATSFLSLVPFASNGATYAQLANLAGNGSPTYAGPGGGDQVMCLSCHRAHASGWPHMLRWDDEVEFIVAGGEYPGTDAASADARTYARGRSKAETSAAYYDRKDQTSGGTAFATYQRVLCNKCHRKD